MSSIAAIRVEHRKASEAAPRALPTTACASRGIQAVDQAGVKTLSSLEEQREVVPHVVPATPDRWDDLAALFMSEDVTRGCWCTWWRFRSSEYQQRRRAENREAFRQRVQAPDASLGQQAPGLLAYVVGRAVGWVSVAPKEEFPRVIHSRGMFKRPPHLGDQSGTWSILCFYIHQDFRGAGIAAALLEAAVSLARQHGARALEAFPVDPSEAGRRASGEGRVRDTAAFPGVLPLFTRAGFTEVSRSAGRPLVWRSLVWP